MKSLNQFKVPETLFPAQRMQGVEAPPRVNIQRSYVFPYTKADRPRALFTMSAPNAIAFYRSWLPARELSISGECVTEITWDRHRPGLSDMMLDRDYICMSVPHDRNTLERVKARSDQSLIVVDVDDWLRDVPIRNPAHCYWQEALEGIEPYFKIADIITVPTAGLRQLMTAYRDESDIVVLPNFYDSRNPCLSEPSVQPSRPWIGFSGSLSHMADIHLIEGPVRRIMARFPQVMYVTFGQIELHHAQRHIPWERKLWIASRGIDTYLAGLRPLTVLLCPLEDNTFNRGKSPLKAIDAIAAGVLPICSRVGPYVEFDQGVQAWAVSVKRWDPSHGEILPMFETDEGCESLLKAALETDSGLLMRMDLLTEFVTAFCSAQSLKAVGEVFRWAYRRKFGHGPEDRSAL